MSGGDLDVALIVEGTEAGGLARTAQFGTSARIVDFEKLQDGLLGITAVGEIYSVTGYVWVPAIKTVFNVTLGWAWDRMALTLAIYPGVLPLGEKPGSHQIKEPFTPVTAPRKLISALIPKLNKRLTGTGSTLGDPRIRAGAVLRCEGLGERFGGLYRVTSATHSLDGGGYHTRFEVRKEIWFGSIPASAQGAVRVRAPFV